MDLRVLVYNAKGFRAGVEVAAAAVAAAEPNLALITEAGTRRRLRRFGRAMGMETAPPGFLPLARTVRNAVLVRPPWRVVSFRLHRFANSRRFSPGGALVAQVGRSGYRVWALSVHLGLAGEERRRHAVELTDLLVGLPGPLLAGGDFNEGPGSPAVRWIGERFWDAWARASDDSPPGSDRSGLTFPAHDPTARIDYLFVSEHVRVAGAEVVGGPKAEGASDHLPLVVDLTLP